jgi:hypothetical protein
MVYLTLSQRRHIAWYIAVLQSRPGQSSQQIEDFIAQGQAMVYWGTAETQEAYETWIGRFEYAA